jgi:hypothetical protein
MLIGFASIKGPISSGQLCFYFTENGFGKYLTETGFILSTDSNSTNIGSNFSSIVEITTTTTSSNIQFRIKETNDVITAGKLIGTLNYGLPIITIEFIS